MGIIDYKAKLEELTKKFMKNKEETKYKTQKINKLIEWQINELKQEMETGSLRAMAMQP